MSTLSETKLPAPSLADELDRVYRALAGVAPSSGDEGSAEASTLSQQKPCLALEHLQRAFGLSDFERDLVVLCVGTALEGRFAAACGAALEDARATAPTFGLALSTFENAHWSALSRARPLRYWRLIEMDPGPLLQAGLRIDERILGFLIDVPSIDERLEAFIRPSEPQAATGIEDAESARQRAVDLGVRYWQRSPAGRPILLLANTHSTARSAFGEICRGSGLRPHSMNAADIPATPIEREEIARIWTRESVLTGGALCLRIEDENPRHVRAWLDLMQTPVAIEATAGSSGEQFEGLRLYLNAMSAPQRRRTWAQYLGDDAQRMNGYLDRIVEYFHFDEAAIEFSANAARDEAAACEPADFGKLVWGICRRHARRSLENLAQRIEPRAAWDDLILPAHQMETLRQIVVHVRRRTVVNEQWGFAAKYARGLGLTALFAGSSGTGKTMAAEVLAADLDLDLYRIDLAAVVSKYIGETEKNLRKVFDAAEESGCVLLFDEADALFGKRSEVRDSHDRYANLEISYLLQRMESYRGVAILTTNMQHALDAAFLRRIRFIVQFPFPDALSRERIWQRVFPQAVPTGGLDFARLAQLNVSGGVIRNIATHAAFFAADDGMIVGPRHIIAAARTEYSKLEKPLTPAETRGFL